MADETLPPIETWMPHDRDAEGGEEVEHLGPFAYDGRGMNAAEFAQFLKGYDFGPVAPDFVVLHHTAVPTLGQWTGGEGGLDGNAIYAKRKRSLDGLMAYYRDTLKWKVGPHLFIDDRYIWLFTPMDTIGIHAMWGNSFQSKGALHYSIGIEVIGDYTRERWPAPVATLVGDAVAALKQRLGTFELRYQYPGGGPGLKQIAPGQFAPKNPERLAWGAVSSHRDYNKPECPGNAITEGYYIEVLQQGWARLTGQDAQPRPASAAISAASPLLGPESGSREQVIKFIRASLPANSEYQPSVEEIVGHYWALAPGVGVDPFLAAAQCVFETAGLTSAWAARPKRNPAGLGVRQEGGLSFATWEDAVKAHLGQLLAFALTDEQASPAQRAMMAANPRHAKIDPKLRGAAKTIADLANRWTDDPAYGEKLAARAAAIQKA